MNTIKRMFKVLQVQKDVLSAGRAALRLHNAFLEADIESSVLSLVTDRNDTDKMTDPGRTSRIVARVDFFMQSFITRKINRKFGGYSFPILGTNISKLSQIKEADVIYLHWVQGGFLNLSGYRQLAELGKPIIVFMHDMWTITGGCHHSFSCEKYMTRCIDCPMFLKQSVVDWPSWEFGRKKKLYSKFENLYFVSPSKWLFNCTKKSFLTKDKPVFHIPNIINSEIYKPLDKKVAREILNLNQEESIVAFGATAISNPYKGWTELEKALNILAKYFGKKDLLVLIFGGKYNKAISDAIPFNTHFMGFLKDEYSTALVYNAADVFVSPSLADNLPTTILECLSCGTPAVGFDVGGIPDMIDHKKNGYLAKYMDREDLASGIRYCLENHIKGYLPADFEKERIIKKHRELFKFTNIGND